LTRARDVANVLSTATSLATDTETAAAISSHNSETTSVHGISDTAGLATQTYVQNNKGINKGNTASRPASPANGDLYYNTETSSLEVYDAGWWLPNTAAGIPTSPVATNQPSSRAFNNGQASVAFTPATSGGKATSFTVTSTPGSFTNTGSSSPIVVTGLQSNTAYTYAVTATGPLGTSSASSASTAVTATTVPQAPTIGTATPGNGSATVAYTAGATGGSEVTTFTATSSPGGLTGTGSSPITVSGLTNGTSYTFTVTATNTNGSSAASSASSSVTPVSTIPIEYLVVAGGGSAGGSAGGAGGAGGYRTNFGGTKINLNPATSYTITVGAGGAKVLITGSAQNGNKGVNSSISGTGITTISSTGGGFGGGENGGYNGGIGGSGGGQAGNGDQSTTAAGNEGGYSPVEGYRGGYSFTSGGYKKGGGGGGGSATVGGNGSFNTGWLASNTSTRTPTLKTMSLNANLSMM
jgi:hypothetical protein